jgi:hypothetical protein
MSLALWVTGMRSEAEGMTPSGINLSGNVPLRLKGKSYSVKGCDNRTNTHLAMNPVEEKGFKAFKMPIAVGQCQKNE